MIPLGIVALATLAANGSRQLRYSAVALLGVSLAANVVTAGQLTVSQLAVEGCGALVACGILYVAARDRTYGEDPGWRLWLATIVAAAATAACFATLRTASSEAVSVPLIGDDPSGVTAQVAAFWLISSGVAILVTARTPVRGSLGAILMITGIERAPRDPVSARPGCMARRARVQLLPHRARRGCDLARRAGPDGAPRHLRAARPRPPRSGRVIHLPGAPQPFGRGRDASLRLRRAGRVPGHRRAGACGQPSPRAAREYVRAPRGRARRGLRVAPRGHPLPHARGAPRG